MYSPYKRSRSKLVKKVQRTTTDALTSLWGVMLTPVALKEPTKPKAKPKAPQQTARSSKVGLKSKPVASKVQRKSQAKVVTPTTSLSRTIAPRGALFKTDIYACEHGKRTYKVYIPATAKTANTPLPLMIMLHGCNQTPDDFARGTGMNILAEEFGFLVVYPKQERKSQTNRCWNWYKPSDQARGAGEPALTASLTRHIISEYNVDPAKVYIAGLSAGASTALITATAYPDVFAAVGAHSGLPVGAAYDAASAMLAMRYGMPGRSHSVPLPTIIFHGDADKVVNVRNCRYIATRATEPYPHLRRTQRNGYTASGKKYVRTSHRLGKGRSFIEQWVVEDAGHAWSGGSELGTYTNPNGPDASREMVRFLMNHRTTKKWRNSFENLDKEAT